MDGEKFLRLKPTGQHLFRGISGPGWRDFVSAAGVGPLGKTARYVHEKGLLSVFSPAAKQFFCDAIRKSDSVQGAILATNIEVLLDAFVNQGEVVLSPFTAIDHVAEAGITNGGTAAVPKGRRPIRSLESVTADPRVALLYAYGFALWPINDTVLADQELAGWRETLNDHACVVVVDADQGEIQPKSYELSIAGRDGQNPEVVTQSLMQRDSEYLLPNRVPTAHIVDLPHATDATWAVLDAAAQSLVDSGHCIFSA